MQFLHSSYITSNDDGGDYDGDNGDGDNDDDYDGGDDDDEDFQPL